MNRLISITLGVLISILIVSKDFFIPSIASDKFITVDNKRYELIENHTRDLDVEVYMLSADVLFKYTPQTLPGLEWPKAGFMEYDYDVIKVGTDDKGNILSLICPQTKVVVNNKIMKGDIFSEVEVGEIGGKINPKNGKGVIVMNDVAWKFWGDMEIDGKKIELTKDNAAFVPINNRNLGEPIYLKSIKRQQTVKKVGIDKIFSSYILFGIQDDPKFIQKGLLQEFVIAAINSESPGFLNNGTKLQWNIDLGAPQKISGVEYQKIAHDAHMGNSGNGSIETGIYN
tara:strand:+ start:461 stop:1315 length:855 start_codon:yes stop_codon:yes gene_type:complete